MTNGGVKYPMKTVVAVLLLAAVAGAPALGDTSSRRHGFSPKDLGMARSVPLKSTPVAVAVSADGRWLAVACAGNSVHIFDTSTWKEARVVDDVETGSGLAFSPNGKILATGSEQIRLINTAAWAVEGIAVPADSVLGLAWSPDGKRLLSTSSDQTARVWDVATRQEILTLRGHRSVVWDAAWSSDGRRLATVSADGSAILWNPASGKIEQNLEGGAALCAAAFSKDGSRLVTAGPGIVRAWDVGTGLEIWSTQVPTGAVVRNVAFTPDQRCIVMASGTVLELRDAATGKSIVQLKHHSAAIGGIAVDPGARWIATVAADCQIKIWKPMPGGMARVRPKGYLGVSVESGNGEVIISGVWPDTAAERAGLRAGDVILSVGGTKVTSMEEAIGNIGAFFQGDEVEFAIKRDGQELKIKARLGERPENQQR